MAPLGLPKSTNSTGFVLAFLLAACGCQGSARNSVWFENSNAEKRFLEQQLYDWQFECERLEQENDRLREQLDDVKGGKTGKTRSKKDTQRSSSKDSDLELDLEAPEIDMGRPAPKKSTNNPPTTLPENAERPEIEDASAALPGGNSGATRRSSPERLVFESTQELGTVPRDVVPVGGQTADEVAEIHINRFLTAGLNRDGKPGDDSITLVVEPRDRQGKYVPQAAPVSVVLLDPALSGDEARVARWDFDLIASSRFLRDPTQGRGLQFILDLPAPPQHARLKLVVRYHSMEGKKLEKWLDIILDVPGQTVETWSPKSKLRTARNDEEGAPVVDEASNERPVALAGGSPTLERPLSSPTGITRDHAGRPSWKPQR